MPAKPGRLYDIRKFLKRKRETELRLRDITSSAGYAWRHCENLRHANIQFVLAVMRHNLANQQRKYSNKLKKMVKTSKDYIITLCIERINVNILHGNRIKVTSF